MSRLQSLAALNRNFVLNVALAALQGFADSLAGGTVGVAFIYSAFGDSNAKVGFVEALQGISSLATALPAGWAADRWPRSRVIAVGGFTSLAAAPLFAYSVVEAANSANSGESSHQAYVMLCVAFALFGFGSGIGNGPAQALMADSIPTGQRSKYYNWLFQAYVVPGVLGPLIGIAWFLTRGDKWSLKALQELMLVGICLQLPIAACMFSFRDDRSLGRQSESVTARRSKARTGTASAAANNTRNRDKQEGGGEEEEEAHAPTIRFSEVSTSGFSLTAAGDGDDDDENDENQAATPDPTNAVPSPSQSSDDQNSGNQNRRRVRRGEGTERGGGGDLVYSSLRSPLLSDEVAGGGGGGGGGRVSDGFPPQVVVVEAAAAEDAEGEGAGQEEAGQEAAGQEALHVLSEWVPCIVFSSSLIVALASGMTIKYFPLYFKNTLHMTPAAVQGIYVVVPFAMALASQLATKLGKVMGRVQAVIALRLTGLTCFSAMVVMDSYVGLDGDDDDDDGGGGKRTEAEAWFKWAIVVAYVCRTALMNCSYPLEESILMDYAPKATRARWKSLESVSMAGWCGSAFVGGILADAYGYTFTFIITIALQAAGTLVYASLLGVVVVEVHDTGESTSGTDRGGDEEKPPQITRGGYQKHLNPDMENENGVVAVAVG